MVAVGFKIKKCPLSFPGKFWKILMHEAMLPNGEFGLLILLLLRLVFFYLKRHTKCLKILQSGKLL